MKHLISIVILIIFWVSAEFMSQTGNFTLFESFVIFGLSALIANMVNGWFEQ